MEIPADYAQANLMFTGDAVPTGAEITLGLFVGDYAGDPDTSAEDTADAWDASEIETLQGTLIALTQVRVKWGPQSTGPTGEWTGAIAGSSSGAQVTPNVAILVRKLTDQGGRAGTGRMYIPGFKETQMNEGGTLDGAFVTLMNDALTIFRNNLILSNLIPVLLHSAGSPITTPTPITSLSCQGTVATQRRRLRR